MQVPFDPLTPEYLSDPHPQNKLLRDEAPCTWSDAAQSWVVSRYEDCKFVLRENELFARDATRAGRARIDSSRSIQTEDPPSQLILRRRMMKALHAQDLTEIAREAFDVLAGVMRDVPAGAEVDVLRLGAAPAAMSLISRTLGVEGMDPATYLRASTDLTRAMDSGFDPSRLPAGMAAGDGLRAQVRTWFAAEPTDGMLKVLESDPIVASELDAKGPRYLANTVGGIFNAGFSTSFAIVGALLQLHFQDPDVLPRARAAEGRDLAINELIRYLSPAQATSRFAVDDIEMHGQRIQRGQAVITLMASANRDEREFEDPDDIVLDRALNRHLGFAWGPHVCLGAQLATAWMGILIERQEDWLGGMEFVSASRVDSATLRTCDSALLRREQA